MTRWSLWGRTEAAFLLEGRPGHSENVIRHIAARHHVEIQVTYDGVSWGQYYGNPRALLFFTIQFSQPRGGILKDTQITFSFDCHPTEKGCHTDSARKGCQLESLDERRGRGVVDVSVPSFICGAKVDRAITRHFEYEAAPNFNIAPFGTISLGHIRGEAGYTQSLSRCWDFTSRTSPPTKYHKFPDLTDVSYEWKHNKNDIELYPRTINVAVIVDCGQARVLPLTLRIDGSLGGFFTYFTKLKDHEVSLEIEKERGDPAALIQRIERLAGYQNDTLGVVTFEVECLNTSEDDVSVKLVGNIDILGCWEPKKASALTKIRDDGRTAVWKVDKLLNMGEEFRYKFIRESNGGLDVAWERGDDRIYSRRVAGTKPEQRQPIWGTQQ